MIHFFVCRGKDAIVPAWLEYEEPEMEEGVNPEDEARDEDTEDGSGDTNEANNNNQNPSGPPCPKCGEGIAAPAAVSCGDQFCLRYSSSVNILIAYFYCSSEGHSYLHFKVEKRESWVENVTVFTSRAVAESNSAVGSSSSPS